MLKISKVGYTKAICFGFGIAVTSLLTYKYVQRMRTAQQSLHDSQKYILRQWMPKAASDVKAVPKDASSETAELLDEDWTDTIVIRMMKRVGKRFEADGACDQFRSIISEECEVNYRGLKEMKYHKFLLIRGSKEDASIITAFMAKNYSTHFMWEHEIPTPLLQKNGREIWIHLTPTADLVPITDLAPIADLAPITYLEPTYTIPIWGQGRSSPP